MANEITKIIDQSSVEHPLRDAAAQTALTGILTGQSIDSFGDVESALDEKFPRSEQAVLGAKNLIPYPYADGMSKETNGITFTVQNDGSVVANGTATGQALFELWKINTFKLPIGKAVTLNGGIDNKAMIQYWAAGDFDYKTQGSDVSFTPTTDALASGRLTIFVDTGKTLNNAVFKPMIRLATDTDDTYAPYAKTNRELTVEKADASFKGVAINLSQIIMAGYITSGTSELHLFIPCQIKDSYSSAEFSGSPVTLCARGIKGYLSDENNNTMDGQYSIIDKLKVSGVLKNPMGAHIVLKNKNDGIFGNVDNNTPIAFIFYNGFITFS